MPDSNTSHSYTPQAGIFALGTSSHAYLEFDLIDSNKIDALVSAIAAIREPRTTTGGVNFVIGFRPELWRMIAPENAPENMESFQPIEGAEGFRMPATQHDALVWLSGSAYDVVFDMARTVIRDLTNAASLEEETSSWSYRHDRDLTGFIDGSENPSLLEAPVDALLPQGVPGAAGSILLLQKWKHKTTDWGVSSRRSAGTRHGTYEAGEYGTGKQAVGLARGADRPGYVRQDLSTEHAVR